MQEDNSHWGKSSVCAARFSVSGVCIVKGLLRLMIHKRSSGIKDKENMSCFNESICLELGIKHTISVISHHLTKNKMSSCLLQLHAASKWVL